MTIASEISRLQCAKADIKTAIEGKGVTVGSNDTIDCYAGCIDNIPTGISGVSGMIDLLVVGGGGNGGSNSGYGGSGGGGGGGIIYKEKYGLSDKSYNIVVGARGNNSCFGSLIAYAGGNGGGGYMGKGGSGGNGGGSAGICSCNYNYCGGRGFACPGQGQPGGDTYNGSSSGTAINGATGGGGGGYSSAGKGHKEGSANGGCGFTTDISGQSCTYGGGGGGGAYLRASGAGAGGCGGGGAGTNTECGGDATYYGGGGGGNGYHGGRVGYGCQGIVILRYKTDGSYGITNATGGTKYTCGDYTIHCFTSNGTFTIAS